MSNPILMRVVRQAAVLTLACVAACGTDSTQQAAGTVTAAGLGNGGQTQAAQTTSPDIPLCTAMAGSGPTVVGPIPSQPAENGTRNHPWLATNKDLRAFDYVEEEYFLCGKTPSGDYTTRMMVRRPRTSERFTGHVFAEWQNVSAGHDLDILWLESGEHIMRQGYAYVAVSAQRTGHYITPLGTAAWNPQRYAQLKWPGAESVYVDFPGSVLDPDAYEIYTQALQSLRSSSGARPLGDLKARKIIATGGSQSAGTLEIYYTTRQLLTKTADAYMPFELTTASTGDHPADVAFPIQADVIGTPVLLVNTETDLDLSNKPDTPLYRQWEVAGTTHYDQPMFLAHQPLLLRDTGVDFGMYDRDCAKTPRSRIPYKHVLNAAMDAVVRWTNTGEAPPSQPRMKLGMDGKGERDAQGNILGGIRLPEHEVATATNSRFNSTTGFCYLYGSHAPFSTDTLRKLYGTPSEYIRRFDAAAEAAVKAGVLTATDAALSREQARKVAF